ncbi:hypothetical protein UCRNP2_7127 [Neofusicoccum parvum UCRNP2]|uniref:Uncharacterized protein n=2 Tax=Neofusicoccum parvum TaxID=310453 RepID=R1G409_BOTPV|nr:hypothetical protein UCRNP2_7127 [Neofusicoccum parvum UCRNP2]GME43748.1 hypothetical protein GTA08_BOTSDO09061 [Neofusicoccum parvum]
MPSVTRSSSSSSRSSTPPKYPPPSYGATYGAARDIEANVESPVKSKGEAREGVRMEPAWVAWRRERMQILGPVQQDKRVLLWAWTVLCILAITLGIGLGLAYKKTPPGSDST